MSADATAIAEPASSNRVKVEDAGPARKRLTITIPAESIDEKLQESMSTLSTQTVLPGFRKGKAPKALLERRFGESVRTETKNQLVASAYALAIEEHKLKPVGEPEPSEEMKDLDLAPGKPLTFSLEVEVVPDFELPSFEGIEIKKPMLEINDEMIENEIKRQCIVLGTPSEIKGGYEEGDRIGGYATVTRNDEAEPFFRQDDVLIVHPGSAEGGRGQVLGLMIDGLAGLLKGKTVGDTITIETVGPDAHEREDIRGAKLTITFEIRATQRVTPASPVAVAERYGLPGEEILREQIKMALEHRRDEEQAAAMREQAIDQVAEKVDFPLPEKLSESQAARNLESVRMELLYRGQSPEEVEDKLAELRNSTENQTQSTLKRFFLLHKLGEFFNIEVSEQEVNGRIAAIAAQRNIRPERLRSELAQAGRLGEVARMVRDQKAGDRVVAAVKQVEVSAEEWNDIFKKKQAETNKKMQQAAKAAKSESKAESKSESKAASKAEASSPKKKAAAAKDDDEAPKKKSTKKK